MTCTRRKCDRGVSEVRAKGSTQRYEQIVSEAMIRCLPRELPALTFA